MKLDFYNLRKQIISSFNILTNYLDSQVKDRSFDATIICDVEETKKLIDKLKVNLILLALCEDDNYSSLCEDDMEFSDYFKNINNI